MASYLRSLDRILCITTRGRNQVLVRVAGQQYLTLQTPKLQTLNVNCAKNGMTVTVEFDHDFSGIIYSQGFYSDSQCRYVAPGARAARAFTFSIPVSKCGTVDKSGSPTENEHAVLENTLVIQNDPIVQEAGDTARRLRCVWRNTFLKKVSAKPFEVQHSVTVPVTFTGDTVNALMEVQEGRGPFAKPTKGYLHIGEESSLVVYVQDPSNRLDARMMDCKAADGRGRSVQLTDKNGCVTRPGLMTQFFKTRATGNTSATFIMYAYFKAFRLPDTPHFYVRCNMQVCPGKCVNLCQKQNGNTGALLTTTVDRSQGRNHRSERRHIREVGQRTEKSADQNQDLAMTVPLSRHVTVYTKTDTPHQIASRENSDHVCMPAMDWMLTTGLYFSLLFIFIIVALIMFRKMRYYRSLANEYRGYHKNNAEPSIR